MAALGEFRGRMLQSCGSISHVLLRIAFHGLGDPVLQRAHQLLWNPELSRSQRGNLFGVVNTARVNLDDLARYDLAKWIVAVNEAQVPERECEGASQSLDFFWRQAIEHSAYGHRVCTHILRRAWEHDGSN